MIYRFRCLACGELCDTITKTWQEKDEFWGAPCYRVYEEEVSECCCDEIEELAEPIEV